MAPPKKRNEVRSAKATVAKRADEMLEMILAGAEYRDLCRHASEKRWNVSERQIQRYIRAAYKILDQSLERSRRKLMNRHLASRRLLYAHAVGTGDFRVALAVLQDEAKLQRMYPSERNEHTFKGGPIIVQIVEEIIDTGPKASPPSPSTEGIPA